ncbi:MAG TPA: hypothetical protein VEF72_13985 [Mycobacterium sp.]|nr:hypothetical protein [Mycobacterium sp.]
MTPVPAVREAAPLSMARPYRQKVTVTSKPITIRAAGDAYLDSTRSTNTRRA